MSDHNKDSKPYTVFHFDKDCDRKVVWRKVVDLLMEKNIDPNSVGCCPVPGTWLCVYNFGQEGDAVKAIESFDWPSIDVSLPKKELLGVPVEVVK